MAQDELGALRRQRAQMSDQLRDSLADQVVKPRDPTVEALASDLARAPSARFDVAPLPRKISAEEANYVEDGPEPFVCRTCKNFDAVDSMCRQVEGPYEEGSVDEADACRLWVPRPSTIHSEVRPGDAEDDDDAGPRDI